MSNSLLFPGVIQPLLFAPLLLLWPQLVLAQSEGETSCEKYCELMRQQLGKDDSNFQLDCQQQFGDDEREKKVCTDTCNTCRNDEYVSSTYCFVSDYDEGWRLQCPPKKQYQTEGYRPRPDYNDHGGGGGGGGGSIGVGVILLIVLAGCICKCAPCSVCASFYFAIRRNQGGGQLPVYNPQANKAYGPIATGASTTSTDTAEQIDFRGLFEKVKRQDGPPPSPPATTAPPPASSKSNPAKAPPVSPTR